MADLTPKDASQIVSIVGIDSTTGETNPVNSTVDGELLTKSKITNSNGTDINSTNPLSVTSTQLPTALSSGNLKTEINLPATYLRSSFGALRVVNAQSVFESMFSFNKQPLVWDEVLTGGATSVLNVNTRTVDMTLPVTAGASAIRQTYRRIRYNPSRTVQLLSAAVMGSPKANVRKRIGQFDEADGVFFEIDGLTVNCVRRTSTSGSVVDVKYSQSSWNIDTFTGLGGAANPSGIAIDFNKHNLFYIQYAFQGFGDIVWGFYFNGQIVFCHREVTVNTLTTPFMSTAHLPCRVEITNTGTAPTSSVLSYNSMMIKNEGGGSEIEGQVLSYSSAPIKTVDTLVRPVISVKLGPGFEKAIADILATSIFVQTLDEVIWTVWLNPTLTGATFSVNASYTQLDTAATAMTGGTELISGILNQNQSSTSLSQDLLMLVNSLIGSNINNVSQVITVAARSRAGTADVLSALVWREYP